MTYTNDRKPSLAYDSQSAEATPETEAETRLRELNAEYAVVKDGGRVRVMRFRLELGREVPEFLSFEDFKNFFCHIRVPFGDATKPLGQWWLHHPQRLTYHGLVFLPGAPLVVDGSRNLWRGFAVEPRRGDWSLMRRHIAEVLANGDEKADNYIYRWCAWLVQHPAIRAEAALVFRGKKGTGKGTLGNLLRKLFGQHAHQISSADHLVGRFNAHFRDCVFLFADEALWPGDKSAEGTLKRIITEPELFIEAKGRDAYSVPNMLHILMASNEDWVIPAGDNERRFAVFDVSDHHIQDEEWFTPLYRQMENGGLAAMLYDLLHFDLGGWHPRRVTWTPALAEQQVQSLRPNEEWWCGLLESGVIPSSNRRYPNRAVTNDYEIEVLIGVTSRLVKRPGLLTHARGGRRQPITDAALGRFLAKKGCVGRRHGSVRGHRGWEFPPLAEARQQWERDYPGWRWRTPALTAWEAEDGGEDDDE